MSLPINKCFFTIGNLIFKQDIGIPMGFDPAPFWASLLLYYCEFKYIKQLISNESSKAYKYHGISRFISYICAVNNGSEFLTPFKNFYPEESNSEETLPLDKFSFFLVQMPHISSNVSSTIFYGSLFSELLQIARCALRINDFIPKVSDLLSRMMTQGGNRARLTKQLKKLFHRYLAVFQKIDKIHEEINISNNEEHLVVEVSKTIFIKLNGNKFS